MKNFIFAFTFLLLGPLGFVQAQVQNDDFFEDEFDEPMDEFNDPNRGGFNPSINAPPIVPGAPRVEMPTNPTVNNNGGFNPGFRGGGGGSFGSTSRNYVGGSEIIEFRLVDPPKYWKPKKRKMRPPVTSQ